MTVQELPKFEEEAPEDEAMSTFEQSVICINLGSELRNFLKGKNLGRVADSSLEYRFLEKKPRREGQKADKSGRFPDISFVRQERLPQNWRDYPTIAPDLAVEVSSPGDKDYEIELKIKEYQKAGVPLVWWVHPVSRTIDVYHLATKLKKASFTESEELEGEDVIPGLKLPLSAIFDFPPVEDDFELEKGTNTASA